MIRRPTALPCKDKRVCAPIRPSYFINFFSLSYIIYIFTHLKLWLATAIHNVQVGLNDSRLFNLK